ncbi:AraC family transcriptional regulator [Paenibacillus sp. MBLB4367]|uniref:AraC family transcriptional regulator n=1 Tax=Paenibacillus sp. MBLB4367 TaxID=3384767 RepID=UPI00390816EA
MRKYVTMTVFNKILLSYLLTIFIPTVLIGSFYFYAYSGELKDEYKKTASIDNHHLSAQISTMLSSFDGISLQLSFMSNLNELLSNPFQSSIYDFNVLKSNLINQTSPSRMIHSVYVYFKLTDKVLTTNEGFYLREEFYDKAYIDGAVGGDEAAAGYEVRSVRSATDVRSEEVISFKRKLPLTGKFELGQLIVNVSKDSFFGTLQKTVSAKTPHYYIVDRDNGNVLFSSRDGALAKLLTDDVQANGIPKTEKQSIRKLGDEQYFTNVLEAPVSSWMIVQLTPYSLYKHQLTDKFYAIGQISILVIALGLVLSYTFAFMFYSPWKKILKSYASNFTHAFHPSTDDEYTLVRKGIDHLIDENRQVRSTMEQHEPLIRHRLIYDLLHNNGTDATTTLGQLQQVGIHVELPYYTVCIVDTDMREYASSEDYNKIKLYVFGLIETTFRDAFLAYGTMLDEGRFAYVLNFGIEPDERLWKQTITESCRAVSDSVHMQFQLDLQFSFGKACRSLHDLHESFAQARRGTNFKALYNKSDVVFMHDTPSDRGFEYPFAIQKLLIGSVKAMDAKKMNDAVAALFRHYIYSDKYSYERTQEMIVMLLSTVMNELLQDGYDTDALRTIQIMKIHDCRNNKELEQFILTSLGAMMNRLDPQQDKRNNNMYIDKSIAYMESHYRSPISISDIADHVGLSSSYLSRIFKAETGHSPLDYLTKHRIACSKELLKDNRKYSLQEISGMIGYADVHSFIRFFKKYEAVTPGEFRKMQLEQK